MLKQKQIYKIQKYVTVYYVKQNSKKILHNTLTLQPHVTGEQPHVTGET